jgi:hypothetical protein
MRSHNMSGFVLNPTFMNRIGQWLRSVYYIGHKTGFLLHAHDCAELFPRGSTLNERESSSISLRKRSKLARDRSIALMPFGDRNGVNPVINESTPTRAFPNPGPACLWLNRLCRDGMMRR